MKYEYRYCRIFLLATAWARFVSVSGEGIISKFVCPTDSVQAFQNITFDICNSVVSLNRNGNRNTQIARWSFQNCTRHATLLPEYTERVFLDKTGTITIHDVHPWDQAKYTVFCQMRDFYSKYDVQINVMAAPANDCIPKIMHLGNSLLASLKANVCGQPVATLYWKGYSDVSNTSEPVLNLTPGKEAGTYYVCIKGPALKCVKKPLDYCSKVTIGRDSSPPISTSSEPWDFKTTIFIVVGIVLGISLILLITVILLRKHCRQRLTTTLAESRTLAVSHHEEGTGVEEVNDKDNNPSSSRTIIRCEDNLEHLHEEQSIQLLKLSHPRPKDDDEMITSEELPNDDQQQVLGPYSNSAHKRKEAITEHQLRTSSKTTSEFQELCDAYLCKICFENNASVVFMPCNHMITCAECSCLYNKCPACKVTIDSTLNVHLQ